MNYVTGLAVNPAGTSLAVAASMVAPSTLNTSHAPIRTYSGSAYTQVVTITTADGGFLSRNFKMTHGAGSSEKYKFRVSSAGMRMLDNGYIYLAIEHRPRTDSNLHFAGSNSEGDYYGTYERIACYDSVGELLVFYR